MRAVRVAITLALLGGCATSETSAPNVHTVVPGILIRGGQPDEAGFAELIERYRIRTVVNLNDDTASSERGMVEGLGLAYLALPSNSFNPDKEKLLAFLRVVADQENTGPVFVHCRQGMDRTGLAVGLWRVVGEGWDADAAACEVRAHQEPMNRIIMAAIIPRYLQEAERERETWLTAMESQTTHEALARNR